MVRNAVLFVALGWSCAAAADEPDPVKEKLFAAKVAYDTDLREVRKAAGEWFDKREEAARSAGDKKVLDAVKAERTAFDETGELPKTAPANLLQKPAQARKVLDAAYTQAVKEYTKAKKDDEAAAVDKALTEFRKGAWLHVKLGGATVREDHVRLGPGSHLPTVQTYTGGVEVVVVARTEADNIRLDGPKGAAVIFNWEVNPRELRVCRPDGSDKLESGTLATAKVTALKPNTWYTLKWRLTEEGMQISVDGKVVFEEQKRYELNTTAPVRVRNAKSLVDVKEFRVTPLGKSR